MASSVVRWVSRKVAANSPNYFMRGMISGGGGGASRSTFRSTTTMSSPSRSSPSKISPWLMLPPAFEANNNMVFKFYSLAEDKVLDLSSSESVGDDIEFVSSSHGWLTLFNKSNCDLFLCNPLSGRRIKLPPIHTLPIPQKYLRDGYKCVGKVITSCSLQEEEAEEDCRVMMSFGPHHRLAFCSPRTSKEWTPIGAPYHEEDDDLYARMYEDFVYSSKQKLFYCITEFEEDLEAWDLQDTVSPKVIPMDFSVDEEKYPWAARSEEEMELKKMCFSLKYLVVAEESGDLFFVRRHVMPHMAPDGSYVNYNLDKIAAAKLPYKTIGFDVHKYDPEKCGLVYMDDGSLDGLAFFIGNNHSFALSAKSDEFSELKPNSIYFTDINNSIPPKWGSLPFVGHDLGIFNYEDQTFSSCYYPCHRQSIQSIVPAPMWFTPIPTPTPTPPF